MAKLILFTLFFVGAISAQADPVLNLDQPMATLGNDVVEAVRSLWPEAPDALTVAVLMSADFLNSVPRQSPRVVRYQLGGLMARRSLPLGLQPKELAFFASAPELPIFTRLVDLPLTEANHRRAKTLPRTLASNNLIYIYEFIRFYRREMLKPKTDRYRGLVNLGERSVEVVRQMVDEYLRANDRGRLKCQAELAGFSMNL